jgi:hypothetical protein
MSTRYSIRTTECGGESAHIYTDFLEPGVVFLELTGVGFIARAEGGGTMITIGLQNEHAAALGLITDTRSAEKKGTDHG